MESDSTTGPRDVVVVCGVTPDRSGVEVLRQRNESLELGTMRPLREGVPIHGEVVKLKPRADCPLAFDVKVELAAPNERDASSGASDTGARAVRQGPAQVATDRYRERWDAIWNRAPKGVAN